MAQVNREAVEQALDVARAELKKHGGNVELLGVNDQGVVLVRLMGACSGCASANVTLKEIIEKSLKEQLPDISRVEALM
ncbi:MAG: NifU family protein [Desulfarculaceae bacterium]|nr:NifU family protein [Desulfarculaceae bacterium]MCF8047567.1 NifU family protein [Desulfarculaceae bacterium]MCF8063846.1 NifU family protein [Desulfarculaceae bacterium]MCF8099425.1 NifU family protein [Desulfarculaceae bacterium]MCF8122595.1 NifU family protein [Desulfarculaceae bacterium]